MFALSDPIRKGSGGGGGWRKKAKVKFIKRHLLNFWLPSEKGWCDCYSVGTSICRPVISTSVIEAGAITEVITVFSEEGRCYFSFP